MYLLQPLKVKTTVIGHFKMPTFQNHPISNHFRSYAQMIISQKLRTCIDSGIIKAESMCAPYNDTKKGHFTKNVTCSLFSKSASKISIKMIGWPYKY